MSEFVQITISIKKDILEEIESLADTKGQKRTALIRDALWEFLTRNRGYVIATTSGSFNDST